MSKSLNKIIGLLLLPCLVGDPVIAAALTHPVVISPGINSTIFSTQVLALGATGHIEAIPDAKGKVFTIGTIVAPTFTLSGLLEIFFWRTGIRIDNALMDRDIQIPGNVVPIRVALREWIHKLLLIPIEWPPKLLVSLSEEMGRLRMDLETSAIQGVSDGEPLRQAAENLGGAYQVDILDHERFGEFSHFGRVSFGLRQREIAKRFAKEIEECLTQLADLAIEAAELLRRQAPDYKTRLSAILLETDSLHLGHMLEHAMERAGRINEATGLGAFGHSGGSLRTSMVHALRQRDADRLRAEAVQTRLALDYFRSAAEGRILETGTRISLWLPVASSIPKSTNAAWREDSLLFSGLAEKSHLRSFAHEEEFLSFYAEELPFLRRLENMSIQEFAKAYVDKILDKESWKRRFSGLVQSKAAVDVLREYLTIRNGAQLFGDILETNYHLSKTNPSSPEYMKILQNLSYFRMLHHRYRIWSAA